MITYNFVESEQESEIWERVAALVEKNQTLTIYASLVECARLSQEMLKRLAN